LRGAEATAVLLFPAQPDGPMSTASRMNIKRVMLVIDFPP
jgi:hypothetical protein